MRSTLLVSCNTNANSLTISTAQLCYSTLKKQQKTVHHLYLDKEDFTPIISQEEIQRRISFDTTIQKHQNLLASASTLMLFFPDWFGFPPALLVGWLQRVFAPGRAFEYEGLDFEVKTKKGLLSTLKVILAISSDEPKESNAVAHTITLLEKRIFSYCGISNVESLVLYDTHNLIFKQKKLWKNDCLDACIKNA